LGYWRLLGEYFDRWEAMRHSEEWRTQILFYASGLRHVLCLSTKQRIHRKGIRLQGM
jgi:hypothetical protein